MFNSTMDLMYSTFLDTTDPDTPYTSLLSVGLGVSIILHTSAYILVYICLAELFDLPADMLTLGYLVVGLLVIMVAGYIGRLARSKSIMAVQVNRGENRETARQIAKQTLRPAYFTWYFMG